jgi:hypothetical protein
MHARIWLVKVAALNTDDNTDAITRVVLCSTWLLVLGDGCYCWSISNI